MSMEIPVNALASDLVLEVDVTSAYDGDGAAVDSSTASVSAEIRNISQADDIWYQIDSGAWTRIAERNSASISIDLSAQTLQLKRGEFTSSIIPAQVFVQAVPTGLYARGHSLGGGGGGGMRVWDTDPFTAGDFTLDRGGTWLANNDNTNSQPISGNADWTLVGGTPYVIADLTSNQIRNAKLSPVVSIVPSPGMGKALQFLNVFAMPTPGTIPFSSVDANIFYDGDTTQLVGNNSFMSLGFGTDPPPSTVFATSIGSGVENFTRGTIEDTGLMLKTDTQNATEGALLTGTVSDGGSGYAIGNTFTVDGFTGSFHVTTLGAPGVVTAFAVDDGGFAFDPSMTGLTTTATSGGGSGLIIDVATVTPANGTARVKITYDIVDLP